MASWTAGETNGTSGWRVSVGPVSRIRFSELSANERHVSHLTKSATSAAGSKRPQNQIRFIHPNRLPTDEPVIDELTMRMTSALRRASVSYERFYRLPPRFYRLPPCVCGAVCDPAHRVLSNGAVTTTLCVHYLAYHRTEVPVADLNAVRRLPASAEMPSSAELGTPEYRPRQEAPYRLLWRVDNPLQEEVDEQEEMVRCRYELVLGNLSSLALSVRKASFQLSLNAAYSAPESIEAGWNLAAGNVWRVPHAPVFRVAEFRDGRSEAIAASLSVVSFKAITWEFVGTYANGEPLGFAVAVVHIPAPDK